MTQTRTTSKVATAQVLGTIAFKAGKKRVAAHDADLMELLAGVQVGDGSPILKAWLAGWDNANLYGEVA